MSKKKWVRAVHSITMDDKEIAPGAEFVCPGKVYEYLKEAGAIVDAPGAKQEESKPPKVKQEESKPPLVKAPTEVHDLLVANFRERIDAGLDKPSVMVAREIPGVANSAVTAAVRDVAWESAERIVAEDAEKSKDIV